MILRPYQKQAIENALVSLRDCLKTVLVAPTGAGKTVIASEVIRRCVKASKHVLFLAHREELIDQCSAKLDDLRINHGIIAASKQSRLLPSEIVQVASIQTLYSRIKSKGRWTPQADLIICDECHRIRGKTWMETLAAYPRARVLGLTATPCRLDGKGLGAVFNDMVISTHTDELIEMGFLIEPEHMKPSVRLDLDVNTKGNDYDLDALADRMLDGKIMADLVETYRTKTPDKPAIIFACSVKHSKAIAEQYTLAGLPTVHVDGDTPKAERARIVEDFRSGVLKRISNVNLYTEGFDAPHVEVVQLARRTMSMSLYRQMVGRVMRTHPGKSHAYILDHAGCIFDHGRVTDRINYSLDDEPRGKKREVLICATCLDTYHVSQILVDDNGQRFKPCGHLIEKEARESLATGTEQPAVIDGELVSVKDYLDEKTKRCKYCGGIKVKHWWTVEKKKSRSIRSLSVYCTSCSFFHTTRI